MKWFRRKPPRIVVTYKSGCDLTIVGSSEEVFNTLVEHAKAHGLSGWRCVGNTLINMSEVQQVVHCGR